MARANALSAPHHLSTLPSEPRLIPQPTGIPNEPSLLTPTTAPLWPVITNAQCASPLSLGPNM